jgi:hypothetical protein
MKLYNVCPSMNSRRIEVGGIAAISAGLIAAIYPRNFRRRAASTYAGEVGEILRRRGSA